METNFQSNELCLNDSLSVYEWINSAVNEQGSCWSSEEVNVSGVTKQEMTVSVISDRK